MIVIENIQKLIKALRSRKYNLDYDGPHVPFKKDDNTYNVTGLMCEVFRIETNQGEWKNNKFKINSSRVFTGSVLPQEVSEWYGFEPNELIPFGDGDRSLGLIFERLSIYSPGIVANIFEVYYIDGNDIEESDLQYTLEESMIIELSNTCEKAKEILKAEFPKLIN